MKYKFFSQDLDYIHVHEWILEFHEEKNLLCFDGNDEHHPDNKTSILLWNPIKTIILHQENDPIEVLKKHYEEYLQSYEAPEHSKFPYFCGGIAGALSYDAARHYEDIGAQNFSLEYPDAYFGIYIQGIILDHKLKKSYAFTFSENKDAAEEFFAALNKKSKTKSVQNCDSIELDWASNFTNHDYIETVESVRDYIRKGDIFQANIAQTFTSELSKNITTTNIYLQMREHTKAPYCALFKTEEFSIASFSPEQFLEVTAEGDVITRPIKGTRPVSSDEAQNTQIIFALQHCEKDRAENIMIVDLMRNDLSKVCKAKSVQVEKLCEIETFSAVHHLVSTVKGKLQHDKDAFDVLRACFPGGSITGAPKIRAMQIISTCEQQPRGYYCGTLVHIDFRGAMNSSILIRTAIIKNNSISFSAGGGITWPSDAAEEYQETIDKAQTIMKCFPPLSSSFLRRA